MTVASQTPLASSAANGVTTTFPHAFTILLAGDLVVTGTLSGVTTTYTNGVDYTITGLGTSSGSVVFTVAPANGTVVTRYRDTAITRATDYQSNGDLPAAVLNADIDRQVYILQEVVAGGKGSPTAIRVPNGETVPALPDAASRADKLLSFDSSGNPIAVAPVAGTANALSVDLASTASDKGDALIGVKSTLAGSVARTQHAVNAERVSVLDFGAVGDGVLATYAGTDNSAALQALFDLAVSSSVVTGGGMEIFAPRGIYCFDTTLDIDTTGVSFFRLIGAGASTAFVYRGTGKAFNFIGAAYDGTYEKLNSRMVLEDFQVYGLPAEVAAGATDGISLIYCAELKVNRVKVHYFNEGFYIEDNPLPSFTECGAVNCNRGFSFKKTTIYADADLAGVNIYNPVCSSNVIDLYINGCRDISVFGGVLASTQSVSIRALSTQVESIKFFGTFFDYTDFTTPTINIGNSADVTHQIKEIGFYDCYYATSASFTKPIIYCVSPLIGSVDVVGGYCSEIAPKLLVLGPACLATTKVSLSNIGANNCMAYRFFDERSVTKRAVLFELPTPLARNPDLYWFGTGGYLPFGFNVDVAANITRDSTRYVTGDASVALSGTGSPSPQAAVVWEPLNGDTSVDPGEALVIEWIVKTATTDPEDTLVITTTNLDGTGAASTIADNSLSSQLQTFTGGAGDGFERWVHIFRVPNNKVVINIKVRGAVGETLYVDYFNVYGSSRYLADEMLYAGAAADLATAGFTVAKFRGRKAAVRTTGANDTIYSCRKDAAGTYSWQLIV